MMRCFVDVLEQPENMTTSKFGIKIPLGECEIMFPPTLLFGQNLEDFCF